MKNVLTSLLSTALFLASSSPAGAALAEPDFFDWSLPGVVSIEDTQADYDESAADITKVRYGSDSEYHYFRLDLAADPTDSFVYGIYVNNEIDRQLIDGSIDGMYTLYTPMSKEFYYVDITGRTGSSFLEWKIEKSQLASVYNFSGLTTPLSVFPYEDILDDTSVGTVPTPTPLPGAVWLLGSGLVALAGMKARKKNS